MAKEDIQVLLSMLRIFWVLLPWLKVKSKGCIFKKSSKSHLKILCAIIVARRYLENLSEVKNYLQFVGRLHNANFYEIYSLIFIFLFRKTTLRFISGFYTVIRCHTDAPVLWCSTLRNSSQNLVVYFEGRENLNLLSNFYENLSITYLFFLGSKAFRRFIWSWRLFTICG